MKSCKTIHSLIFILLVISFIIGCKEKRISFPSRAQRTSDSLDIAYKVLEKGDSLYNLDKALDSAFSHYNKSKTIFIKKDDSVRAGYCLLRMAQIQHASADYFGSESTATEAISYLNNTNTVITIDYLTEAYNLLGMNNWKLYNYSDAINYYHQAHNLSTDIRDKNILKNNIATIYIDQKKYGKALPLLSQLNNSNFLTKDSATTARVLNNLGHIYTDFKKPEAINFLNKSLLIRIKLKDPGDIARSYLQLAEYYINNDTQKALKNAEKAYSFSKDAKAPDAELRSLTKLIELSSGNNLKNYTNRYITLQDSINRIKMMAKNQFAKIKYDAKVAQEKNLLIIQKKQAQNQLLFISLIFFILLVILSYRFIKTKHRQEKLKEVYKTENRISKKIHDELANDLFRVLTQTENLNIDLSKKNILVDELNTAYNKARNISRENSSIDAGEQYPYLLRELLSEYNVKGRVVVIVSLETINWKSVNKLKKVALYRVLQELMTNMIKHSKAKRVVIRFEKIQKSVLVHYHDDGIGLKNNFKSNGLYNAESRILAIGGDITFENIADKGLRISINIPL